MKKDKEDLRQVNPSGRLDVLAYRSGERFTRYIENRHGLNGIWDAIEPHVQDLARGLNGVEIPAEAKILLNIIGANQDK